MLRRRRMRQEAFQAFLRLLRVRYKERAIWILLDEAPGHTAEKSLAVAANLAIELVWLPKQCSELNSRTICGRS
jgi:hypothetical protein